MAGQVVDYRPSETVYSPGDPSDTVFYIQQGSVKLSVVSQTGRVAVVGMLSAGEFFGEGALVGQPVRLSAATAMTASCIRVLPREQMIRLLHDQHELSDRFIAYMLARKTRLEENLVDQLFNDSEKRLARTLLLLARYGKPDGPRPELPRISQGTLAEMVGTTRSRVNGFMNKFRKLGFVEYNRAGLKVHHGLLNVVLHESPAADLRTPVHVAPSSRALRESSHSHSLSSNRRSRERGPKVGSRRLFSAA
jgi:CRP/FNR family cyclic AMP-dependent transcriptional regulator